MEHPLKQAKRIYDLALETANDTLDKCMREYAQKMIESTGVPMIYDDLGDGFVFRFKENNFCREIVIHDYEDDMPHIREYWGNWCSYPFPNDTFWDDLKIMYEIYHQAWR